MRRRRTLAVLLAIASSAWTLALVVVPTAAGEGSSLRIPATISAAVYLAGTTVCHQRAERSFHPGGVRMPVCARCFGLYAAASVGAIAAVLGCFVRRTKRPQARPARVRLVLIAAALPTVIVWAVEWLGLAQPTSSLRAALAAPLGVAAGWLVATAIVGEIEYTARSPVGFRTPPTGS